MFCARCGQQIPDATTLCPLCGRESTIQPQPSPIALSASPAPARIDTAEIAMDGPQGVGGWLQVFCVLTTVVTPSFLVSRSGSLGAIAMLNRVNLIDTIRILYGMIVGIFLWTRSPHAITLLRIYFGLLGIIALLTLLNTISANLRLGWNMALFVEDLAPLLGFLGPTILWYLYFHKSRRVKNTYGKNV